MLSIIVSPAPGDQSRACLLATARKRFLFSFEGIVFSCICDFLSVTTITLERLNQSEPNFHTRLLTEIAWSCMKMGIAGHM